MSRSLRRRGAFAAALAIATVSLSACAAGNDAESLQIKPDNAATTVGDIKIQNAVVITADEGNGQTAVSAMVFNDGSKDQTVESITVDGAGSPVRLSPAEGAGPIVVPAGGSVLFGGEGNPSAVLSRDGGVTTGDYQKVTFDFSRTGEVAIEAHVVSPRGLYESYGPTAEAQASKPAGESPSSGASEKADAKPSHEAGDASHKPETHESDKADHEG